MVTKSMAGVVFALLAGCTEGEPFNNQPPQSPPISDRAVGYTPDPFSTERKVPVLEYLVRPADKAIILLGEETKKSLYFRMDPFDGVSEWHTIKMVGDKDNVRYHFSALELLATLNGVRTIGNYQPNEYQLLAEETIKMPDFNKDGKFNGHVCKRVGYLTFAAARSSSGEVLKKDMQFTIE